MFIGTKGQKENIMKNLNLNCNYETLFAMANGISAAQQSIELHEAELETSENTDAVGKLDAQWDALNESLKIIEKLIDETK